MAYGIYAQPVGPGPAAPAPLFIDSGSTFPQYLGTIDSYVTFSGDTANVSIPGWNGTGSLVAVPIKPIVWEDYIPPELTSFIVALTEITPTSNTNCRLRISQSFNSRAYPIGLNFYQVWPQANQNYGITFSNSANYFSISDSGVVGQCIWAWEGTINGSLQIPNISGFDMSKAIVFANWSSTSAGLAYKYDSRQIRVYQNRSNFSGSNQTGSIAGVKVAVFCNGAGVPVHNGGLNIYSPNGQQCVFSTYRTPFMYKRAFPSGGGATGLAYPMVCLTDSVGAISGGSQGGWYWQHMRAHYMNGGSITTGYGEFVYSWTDQYDLRVNGVVSHNLPLLDAQDYFASI